MQREHLSSVTARPSMSWSQSSTIINTLPAGFYIAESGTEIGMKFFFPYALMFLVGCSARPTLEQLEDEANTTGDWAAVDRREDVIKTRRETTAPGCPVGLSKKCYEAHTGIECDCIQREHR